MKDKKKIPFICFDNICHSSSTEGVMKHLAEQAGRKGEFAIDPVGILSHHQGELPDSRMCAHAARRGYNPTHRSRLVRTDDFYNFDLVIGMDDHSIDDLKEWTPSTEEWKKIHHVIEYYTKFTRTDYIPSPYYGGTEGFEYVLDVLEDVCTRLLGAINDQLSLPDSQLATSSFVLVETFVVVKVVRCIHSGLL